MIVTSSPETCVAAVNPFCLASPPVFNSEQSVYYVFIAVSYSLIQGHCKEHDVVMISKIKTQITRGVV